MPASEISVLIVDAEPGLRASLGFELKSRGFKTSMAASALKAYELFPDMPFQVIVADVGNATGGLELLKFVKSAQRPIQLILTYQERSLDPALLVKQGAGSALLKPFPPDLLRDKIHKLLNLPDEFRYYLNARRSLTIASWVGDIRAPDGDALTRCLQEVKAGRPRYVILNLHDLTDYDPILANDIVKFQNVIRELPAWLVVCGVPPFLRERLSSKGLIVDSEVLPTLKEALQYLLEVGIK